MKTKSLLFFVLMCLTSTLWTQNTINVPGDQPTIQAGIDAAVDGDIVLVDTGTYFENIDYKGRAITVASHYFNVKDSALIYNTVIDGSKPEDTNRASVVTIPINSDTNFVLYGFTIQNGKGTVLGNWRYGGGVFCYDGGKIVHNRIIENTVDHAYSAQGGGIYLDGLNDSCYFVIKNNIIENNYLRNTSNYPGGAYGGGVRGIRGFVIIENNKIDSNVIDGRPYGGGINLWSCDGIINNNTISNNVCNNRNGGNCRGGGISFQDPYSGVAITNNSITGNHLNLINGYLNYGGGIHIYMSEGYENMEILIDKNFINNNSSRYGGGIGLRNASNTTIMNNVIQANESGNRGGGIFIENSNGKGVESESSGALLGITQNNSKKALKSFMPVIVNNTIIENRAVGLGGGIASHMGNDSIIVFNNIIFDNEAVEYHAIYLYEYCQAFVYNNNVNPEEIGGPGTWDGSDNIFVSPKFEDDSCHLLWNSLCIGQGAESVEVDGEIYSCPEHDMDGDARPECVLVDIGADETPFWVKVKEPNLVTTQVSVYPNPASDQIAIVLQPGTKVTSFEILDNQGKIVLHQEVTNEYFSVNISDFPKGLYFIRIHTSEGIEVKKLIIQ